MASYDVIGRVTSIYRDSSLNNTAIICIHCNGAQTIIGSNTHLHQHHSIVLDQYRLSIRYEFDTSCSVLKCIHRQNRHLSHQSPKKSDMLVFLKHNLLQTLSILNELLLTYLEINVCSIFVTR